MAVPTGEELEKCATVWVSGGSLVAEQEVEESPEQVQAKKKLGLGAFSCF